MKSPATPRSSILVALAFTLARLPLAMSLELSPDEAYYWLWSQRLGVSYFDHPPMVAWLIAAFTAILGNAEWVIRLPALLSGFVIAVALADLARTFAPAGRENAAAIATALLASVLPLAHAGAVIVTPDSPAAAFWAIALAAFARARAGNARAWYLGGLAMGLALLSKYTTVLLGVSLAMLVPFDVGLRRALRTPHPWIAGAIAWLLFAPVIVWNAQHEWVSFAFQLDHGTGTARGGGPASFFGYLGAQFAILTPMLAFLVVRHVVRGGDRLLTASVIPTFAIFGILAFKSKPEANWPAFAYLGAAVISGIALAGVEKIPRRLAASAVIAGGLASLLLSIHAVHPVVDVRKDRLRKEFSGWRERGAAARAAAGPEGIILGDSYRVAAEMAYYAGRIEGVGVARRPNERRSMFDLWNSPEIHPGDSVIYVSAKKRDVPLDGVVAGASTETGVFPRMAASMAFKQGQDLTMPEGVRGTMAKLVPNGAWRGCADCE